VRNEDSLEYELEKSYEVLGISVASKVIRDWTDDALGTRHVIVESSCKSERWGTRAQQHSLTTPRDQNQFSDALERVRNDAAAALARVEVLGDENIPPAKLLGIEIEYAGDKRLKAAASLTVATPYSLIQPQMISGLGLASTGRFHYELQGNAIASVPIYTARIHFDDLTIDTLVVPSNHNGTIIVGGDFLQQAFNPSVC
jgi:predicted aspartyl protease